MAVVDALSLAVDKLRSGQLQKEEQVKLAVIQPILRALDWDDADPSQVIPEFSVPEGSVDYALLGPARNPLVFLEAKRPDNADYKGVEQVFRYAANKGVPFLILTDGYIWDFYLSMADGIPADRRFFKIELQLDDKITDYATFFEQYLQRNRVGMPETRLAAEQLRDGDRQREKARLTIASVWHTLLSSPDETLRNLVAEEVERECGTRPELDDVETFIRGVSRETPSQTNQMRPTPPKQSLPNDGPNVLGQDVSDEPKRRKLIGFILDGQRKDAGNGIRTLIELLKEFSGRDHGVHGSFSATSGREDEEASG